jgi:hypothetical protein
VCTALHIDVVLSKLNSECFCMPTVHGCRPKFNFIYLMLLLCSLLDEGSPGLREGQAPDGRRIAGSERQTREREGEK